MKNMPKKKHCDKHYRYVASCPDCRAMNQGEEDAADMEGELYPDASNGAEDEEIEGELRRRLNRRDTSADIPDLGRGDRSGGPRPPGGSQRFQYQPKKTKTPKKVKRII